jgi:CMP-N-acetylneuraminic acid synthetase
LESGALPDGGKVNIIIAARGGSTRIPGKNLVEIEGVPMIVRAVRLGHEVFPEAMIYVSSDSQEILDAVTPEANIVPLLRIDEYLSENSTSMYEVCARVTERIFFREDTDTLILWACTPTLKASTLGYANRFYKRKDSSFSKQHDCVFGAVRAENPPENAMTSQPDGRAEFVTEMCMDSSQLGDRFYNAGQFAFIKTDILRTTRTIYTDAEPFFIGRDEGIDIDYPVDLDTVKRILKRRQDESRPNRNRCDSAFAYTGIGGIE